MSNHRNTTKVEIHADGSCLGNPGPGGYAAVVISKNRSGDICKRRDIIKPAVGVVTNVQMEITAVCAALEALGPPTAEPVTVFTDAQIVTNAMTHWITAWKAKGWLGAKKKPVENKELWQRLDAAAEGRNISFIWVKGDSGIALNDEAHSLAQTAAREAAKVFSNHKPKTKWLKA